MKKRKQITIGEFKELLRLADKIKTGKIKKNCVKSKKYKACLLTLDKIHFKWYKKYNGAYRKAMEIILW